MVDCCSVATVVQGVAAVQELAGIADQRQAVVLLNAIQEVNGNLKVGASNVFWEDLSDVLVLVVADPPLHVVTDCGHELLGLQAQKRPYLLLQRRKVRGHLRRLGRRQRRPRRLTRTARICHDIYYPKPTERRRKL